ncbi:MAG: hypothetical protein IJO05_03490 [Oscillospiraceae bacterium]|nr:hypothetical protein [Oscillospiraceae bacterium]
MTMIFERGVYGIEHDPERTGEFYAQSSDTLCDCAGCRNFRAAVSRMSEELRSFLEQFGIDPAKPAEMSVVYAPAKDELCYNGFYHFCGEIRDGREAYIQTGERAFELDQRYIISVNEGEQAWFLTKCALIDANFPRPAAQVEVFFNLPWVLDEENTYP